MAHHEDRFDLVSGAAPFRELLDLGLLKQTLLNTASEPPIVLKSILHLPRELIVGVNQLFILRTLIPLQNGLHPEAHLLISTLELLAETRSPLLQVDVPARQPLMHVCLSNVAFETNIARQQKTAALIHTRRRQLILVDRDRGQRVHDLRLLDISNRVRFWLLTLHFWPCSGVFSCLVVNTRVTAKKGFNNSKTCKTSSLGELLKLFSLRKILKTYKNRPIKF